MPIVEIVIVLIVVGVLMWLAHTYIPMHPPIRTVLDIVVILALVLWLIGLFFPGFWNLRLPLR